MSIRYYRVSAEKVLETLRQIFASIPEVKIAVLFGSLRRRELVRDVDIGVYLDPKPNLKEFIRLDNMLEDALGIPVDLVPLDRAPPKLRLKALSEGEKVVVRDRKLYAFMISEALSETMDIDIKLREERMLTSKSR